MTLGTSIRIITPVQVKTSTLPVGTVGRAFSATLAVTGGLAPYHWALTSGTLPGGLVLNPRPARSPGRRPHRPPPATSR
jgi:hypothetical protein